MPFTEQLVPPSPAASCPPLSHFFSKRLLFLPYESLCLISLFHLMRRLFVPQPSFLFQVWPDLERNQHSANLPAEPLRQLTRSCFLLFLLRRLLLLALPHLLGICLPSLWSLFTLSSPCSRSDPLSLVTVRLSLTLTLSPLIIRYSGPMALFLFVLAKTAPAYLPTALSVALKPLFLR